MKTFLGPAAIAAVALSACAVGYEPRDRSYSYELGGKSYRLRLVNGRITDTSYVFSKDSTLIRKAVWSDPDTVTATGFKPKLLFPVPNSSADTVDSTRSTESILRVIRKNTPELRHPYNEYLRWRSGFRGRITLRFVLLPDGGIGELLIVENTTGYRKFAVRIAEEAAKWVFEAKSGSSIDIVSVPFTFRE